MAIIWGVLRTPPTPGMRGLLAKAQHLLLLRTRADRNSLGWLCPCRDARAQFVGRGRVVDPAAPEVGKGELDLAPLRMPLLLQYREVLAQRTREAPQRVLGRLQAEI